MDRWVAAISSADSMQAGSQTKAGSASRWQRCADGRLVLLSLEKCLQRDPKDTYNTTVDSRMLPFCTQRVPRWPSLQEAKACDQGRCAIR